MNKSIQFLFFYFPIKWAASVKVILFTVDIVSFFC